MRILVFEEGERLALPIGDDLDHQRYTVETASDVKTGLELAGKLEFDLVLLDLLLPKSISVCHDLRKRGFSSPILIMTDRGTTHDKVLGLDAGADDYLVKPLDPDELSARIRALLRRGKAEEKPILIWGELTVDPAVCSVVFRDALIALTPTEYRLLTFFLRNPGQTFNAESLIERLWLAEESPTKDVIKAHIKGMRRKLREAGLTQNVVETIYGFGYRLKPFAS